MKKLLFGALRRIGIDPVEDVLRRPIDLDRIARREELAERLAGDRDALGRVLKRDDTRQALLEMPELASSLLLDLLKRYGQLLTRIVTSPEGLSALLVDAKAVNTVLRSDRALNELASSIDVLKDVALQPNVAQGLLADGQLIGQWLADPGACALLLHHADLHMKLLSDANVVRTLLDKGLLDQLRENADALRRLVPMEDRYESILRSPEWLHRATEDPRLADICAIDEAFLKTFLWDERIQARIQRDSQLLKYIVTSPKALTVLLSDANAVGKVLRNEGAQALQAASIDLLKGVMQRPEAIRELLADKSLVRQWLQDPTARGYLAQNADVHRMLVSNPGAVQSLLAEGLLDRLREDTDMLGRLVPMDERYDSVFEHLSLLHHAAQDARLLDVCAVNEEFLRQFLWDGRVQARIQRDAALLKHIVTSPKGLGALLADVAAVGKVLRNENVQAQLAATPDIMKTLIRRPEVTQDILSDTRLVGEWLENDACRKYLLHHPDFRSALLLEQGVLEAAVSEEMTGAESAVFGPLAARAAFRSLWRRLRPHIDINRPYFFQRFELFQRELRTPEDVPEAFVDLICDGTQAHLAHGVLEVIEPHAFWTLLQEIVLNEDYYFDSDTDTPRILDCGTNFGMALYYFKNLYPKAVLTGFEPDPQIFAVAQENVKRNGWENVAVLPYALSDTEEETTFVVSEADMLAGSLTGRRRMAGDQTHEIRVQCKPLSGFLDEPVDYLKLDIEGMEDRVLAEAAPKLKNIHYLFVEYHHGNGQAMDRLAKILSILSAQGFDHQVTKSWSSQLYTQRRPMNALDKPYSAAIWARNLDWKRGGASH